MDPADTESGCSATARLSTTAQEEDSAFTAHRNHHARLLFGMRQRGAEIRSFASRFLEEARLAGLSGRELKVIFYACLDEPLRSSEVELLKPLDFVDMINYVRNRPEPKSRPLSPVPEGRVVGRMVLESSAPTTSSSISSAPPASLRGSRLAIRGRGIQTGAIRLGRSTLISAPDLHPALPVSGRRKKRKKDSSALQPAATPQSSEKQQPLSAPLQPLPSAQPPLQPLPSAQPPLQPLPSAQPPLQPLPSAQPPLQPLPSAQPPLQPLPSAQPPLQPLPSAQPTAAAFVSVPSPLPSAAAPVTVPVLSPLPATAPPVMFPVSPQPVNPDLVVPALPQAVSSPRNPVRPARSPRTQPSATPRGQRSRPVPSPIPPPVNVVVPPPPPPLPLSSLSCPVSLLEGRQVASLEGRVL
ncbi:uncharacterized protein [Paramisgurnus dabryanus]|uniref:uncharacterized protein n=1 Tax=Paramisgurnus dabryanus TaxID=90735 RepID=UPI0031F3A853